MGAKIECIQCGEIFERKWDNSRVNCYNCRYKRRKKERGGTKRRSFR